MLHPLKILVRTFSVLICLFANLLNGQSVGDSNSSGLSPFEKAELRRLLDLDFLDLSRTPIRGVLGYEQEHWKNPASVHVIRPEDISLNGHVLMVDSFRNVAGMHTTRGVGTMTLLPCVTLVVRLLRNFLPWWMVEKFFS